MLTPIESIQIWNKLVEQNYPIEKITICSDDLSFIEIIFENKSDLEKFRQFIFDLMYVDIFTNCGQTQLTLFVGFDFNFFLKLTYPKFTKELSVHNTIQSDKIIGLGVLPSELKKLLIISTEPFDLTNLPNKLTMLDLSGCTGLKKFNIDYLPSSLKIFKLAYIDEIPGNTIYDKISGVSLYGLSDFENLPNSLDEIYIGNMFFNSVEEILQKYYIAKK
jgi:hypothetical protein